MSIYNSHASDDESFAYAWCADSNGSITQAVRLHSKLKFEVKEN